MLAHFSLLCRFFCVLGACRSFFRHVGRFFGMLGRSGSGFGAFRVAPEMVLGPSGAYFSFFLVHARLRCPNALNVTKPQFLLGFCVVFTYRKLCAQAIKRRQIGPGACRTEPPAKIVVKTRVGMDSGGVWHSLGRHLAGFCSLLAGFWPVLGASWASLGHFLAALGCLLAALWSFRPDFGLPGPSQASILEALVTSRTEF